MRILNKIFGPKNKPEVPPDLDILQDVLNSKINRSENKNKYSSILFFTFEPLGLYAWRESIVARALQTRNATVSIVQCDIPLQANDMDSAYGSPVFAGNIEKSINFYEGCGFDVIRVSSYVSKDTSEEFRKIADSSSIEHLLTLKVKDLTVADYAINSTVRFFLMPRPDFEDKVFEMKFREYMFSVMLITEATYNILTQVKPDKIFTSHGIYISWSPVYYLARILNIPIDLYGGSYRRNTIRYYKNEPCAPFPIALWHKYKSIPLTEAENKVLDEYIPSRKDNKNDSITLFSNAPSQSKVFEFIKNEKSKGNVVFCLFTNIAWDGFMFKEKTVFKDMFHWITETIQYFEKHPDLSLIIKAHPAENARETKTPEQYRVASILPEKLPSNIYFCRPDENVKPFDLYPSIDVGLIHISTVAIEMALENIPVLTSGANGHYSNKGFTLDPQTEEEYFEMLGKLGRREMKFIPDIESARRYMYYRFFREAIPFNMISLDGWSVKKLQINSAADLLPGKDKALDIVCEGILNDAEFSYDWTKHDK